MSVSEFRLVLQAGGFDPVATNGKRPIIDGWQTKAGASVEEISSWGGTGTGMLTRRTPTLDIDILHPEAATAVEEVLRDWFDGRGPILVRTGLPPKRAIPLRTSAPFKKMEQHFVAPNGNEHKIEILGDGQQVVVDGIHPDTGKPYSWHGGQPGTVPWVDLPETDEKEAAELLVFVSDMLSERFGFKRTTTGRQGGNGQATDGSPYGAFADEHQPLVDVEAEFAAMPASGAGANEMQKRVIPSLARRGWHPDEVEDLVVDVVMAKADQAGLGWTREKEERHVRRRILSAYRLLLRDYDHTQGTIPDWLPGDFHEPWIAALAVGRRPAIGYNRSGFYVRAEIPSVHTGEVPLIGAGDPDAPSPNHGPHPRSYPWPTPYSGRDVSLIPIRNFILGQHYLLGAASITAAAGGVGKSTLHLLEAVSFCIGRCLLTGETLDQRRRVWVWNAEDDVDEMERRVAGICAHYGIDRPDLKEWLFLDSGYDLPLDLAHATNKNAVLRGELIELIAARVKERSIEVVQLDPLVALHSMSEGDNPGHAKLIRTLATKVAKPCGCAVEINTHTRKPSTGQDSALSVDDIRGAGAIVYSARSGRILHPMSLAEAEKYNIAPEDRVSYYRLERAKANMAKRGTICWVRMIEVPIANRPGGSYGDVVAVPTLWVPPDAMEGVNDTIANAIASEIAKGEYRRDARAGSSWAGRLVGLRCGIDTTTKSGKDRAKVILETLIKRRTLAVEIRTDKNRNAREYVVAGGLFHGPR